MKIVNIQYLGPNNERTCIMDTGQGIPAKNIEGESAVTRNVELIDGQYKVVSSAAEACEL